MPTGRLRSSLVDSLTRERVPRAIHRRRRAGRQAVVTRQQPGRTSWFSLAVPVLAVAAAPHAADANTECAGHEHTREVG